MLKAYEEVFKGIKAIIEKQDRNYPSLGVSGFKIQMDKLRSNLREKMIKKERIINKF